MPEHYRSLPERSIFRDMLDEATLAFMDDIMVHAAERQKHDEILLEVLRWLRENNLCNKSLASARWRDRSSDGTPDGVLDDVLDDALDDAQE